MSSPEFSFIRSLSAFIRLQTLVLEALVAGREPLPRDCTVELRCAAAVRNVCHCAACPAPLPFPHRSSPAPTSPYIHSERGEDESLARCGRLYQFQIVYRIIFSDSTHRRGPEMNLRRESGVAGLTRVRRRIKAATA